MAKQYTVNKTHENESTSDVAKPAAAATDEEEMNFDVLLSAVGCGLWQVWVSLLALFLCLVMPVHLIGGSFTMAPMKFRCFEDPFEVSSNESFYSMSHRAIESDDLLANNSSSSNDIQFHFEYYDSKCLSGREGEPLDQNASSQDLPAGRYATNMATCPYIEYDTAVFSSTVISEFHIVCERAYMQPYYQMIYNVGGMVGTVIFGFIADKFGRMTVLKVASILNSAMVILHLLISSYDLVLVARFFHGTTSMGILTITWGLLLECTPTKQRGLVGMLMGLPYSCTIIIFSVVGYFIRDWRTLFLTTASPIVFLVPVAFLAEESPRWLLQKKERARAEKEMEKAARQNRSKLTQSVSSYIDQILKVNKLDAGNEKRDEKKSLKEQYHEDIQLMLGYFRNSWMRKILLVTPIIWFLHNFLYLAVAINANNFTSTNPFLYVGLTGVMDGASILLATPLTACLGRRVLVSGMLLLGAIMLLIDMGVTEEYYALKWIMVMGGFFLCAGSLQANYMYGPELFPTEVRNKGFSFISTVGSLGFMVAPFITTSVAQQNKNGPSIFFGCAGIIAAALVPILPETRNKPMPESLQDVDKLWGPKKKVEIENGVVNIGIQINDEK